MVFLSLLFQLGLCDFPFQIEADQLREHVVNSWADQVVDKEEVKSKLSCW